jgi:hypothetical protein
MCPRLRKLGTPISNQTPFLCATSTSCRVGETTSCNDRLDVPSRMVLKMLIRMCKPVSYLAIKLQFPLAIVDDPSRLTPLEIQARSVSIRLVMQMIRASVKHDHRTTFCRFRLVLKVTAYHRFRRCLETKVKVV